jgi:hypothetical protein
MTQFSILFISLFCIRVNASSYTADELFTKLDSNNDGIITRSELTVSSLGMSYVNIVKKEEECSCFRCDGRYYSKAEVCDVYDNSGCENVIGINNNCYTTNDKKCECNTVSKDPYICKIPLTHSFVNFLEKGQSYNIKLNKPVYSSSEYDNMERRTSASYQTGRDSAFNDMIDLATTYVVVDTMTTIMSDALMGKD